jgi:hypothetical protein
MNRISAAPLSRDWSAGADWPPTPRRESDGSVVDIRRCPECNVFGRKVGVGGCCPSWVLTNNSLRGVGHRAPPVGVDRQLVTLDAFVGECLFDHLLGRLGRSRAPTTDSTQTGQLRLACNQQASSDRSQSIVRPGPSGPWPARALKAKARKPCGIRACLGASKLAPGLVVIAHFELACRPEPTTDTVVRSAPWCNRAPRPLLLVRSVRRPRRRRR